MKKMRIIRTMRTWNKRSCGTRKSRTMLRSPQRMKKTWLMSYHLTKGSSSKGKGKGKKKSADDRKKKSQRASCKQHGHWHGDPECPMTSWRRENSG